MGEVESSVTHVESYNTENETFDSTDDRNLLDKLIGSSNESSITMCVVDTTALMDSGYMITCVSESSYSSLDPKPILHSLADFKLNVYGTGTVWR